MIPKSKKTKCQKKNLTKLNLSAFRSKAPKVLLIPSQAQPDGAQKGSNWPPKQNKSKSQKIKKIFKMKSISLNELILNSFSDPTLTHTISRQDSKRLKIIPKSKKYSRNLLRLTWFVYISKLGWSWGVVSPPPTHHPNFWTRFSPSFSRFRTNYFKKPWKKLNKLEQDRVAFMSQPY